VLLARAPDLVEAVYGRSVGPAIGWALSRVTGVVPFSVGEVLILGLAAWVLWHGIAGVTAAARRRRSWKNLLLGGLLTAGQLTGIIVALFYVLWGFQYSRPRLEARLGWPAGTEAPADVLAELAEEMVGATNAAYAELHHGTDSGEPTRFADRAAMEAALEEGWRRAAEATGLDEAVGRRSYGPVKRPLILSRGLDWLGISGFYLPFTGEANVNRGIPDVSYPHTAAHEKSHQRGLNPEDEANFFGYLAAVSAPDPVARYSAYLFAQRQLLAALWIPDEERTRELIDQRLPGVQRDVDAIRAYWARFEGPVRDASRQTNDAFLRTNRVEGGVHAYARSVELMVAWARKRGGRLAP
jgi:hypothetical protein